MRQRTLSPRTRSLISRSVNREGGDRLPITLPSLRCLERELPADEAAPVATGSERAQAERCD
jgi:hypothetical protein